MENLQPKKFLTLQQANTVLDTVEPLLMRLQDLAKSVHLIESVHIHYEDEYAHMLTAIKANKQFHTLYAEFYNILDELVQLGCIVKDIEEGLVDFYSHYEGREIFLCWQLGEDSVQYWHEIDSGSPGRKPISLLNKKVQK
jgi:hypothetical protein